MWRLFLLALLVVGLMWFAGRLGKMNPQMRAKYLKLALLYGGGLILLVAILSGRLHPFFAAIAALFPWIQRAIMLRSAYNMFTSWQGGPVQGSRPGQTSDVKTKFLEMFLDHDTGTITGKIIRGKFSGRSFDDLTVEEIAELLAECRIQDRESVPLIESYLDRMRADEWDEYAKTYEPPESGTSGAMTREEALEILGLKEGATKKEVIEAHKILMQRNHPDRGGSTWVAARINQAKEVLLS